MFEDFASEQRPLRASSTRRERANYPHDYDIPTDDDLFWYVYGSPERGALRGNFSAQLSRAAEDWSGRGDHPLSPTIRELVMDIFGEEVDAALFGIHSAIYQRTKVSNPAHFVLGAVLSSELDADKVSYLPHDAAQTGSAYGQGVDVDGVLNALRCPSLEDI